MPSVTRHARSTPYIQGRVNAFAPLSFIAFNCIQCFWNKITTLTNDALAPAMALKTP